MASLGMESAAKIAKTLADMKVDPKLFFSVTNGQMPLLVFCNPKSGGQSGANLLKAFKAMVDPSQVFDMMEKDSDGKICGATQGLEKYGMVQGLVVVVCGGDGTVGWVLSTMEDLHLTDLNIPVCVFPLGTGNDLARSLKYGSKYSGTSVATLCQWILDSASVYMDRWKIDLKELESPPTSPSQGLVQHDGMTPTLNPPQARWNNYFSIGSCAHITMGFHLSREQNPRKHNSRMKNRHQFGMLGLREILAPKFVSLSDNLELICDGVDYTNELRRKKIVSLAFINIQYFMAGAQPWGTVQSSDGFDAPKMSDGRVEVIGYTGRTGIAMAQVKMFPKMVSAWKICQCKSATLKLHQPVPAQLDGEPFLPAASTITLTSSAPAVMLVRRKEQYKHLPSFSLQRMPAGGAVHRNKSVISRISRAASLSDASVVDEIEVNVYLVHLTNEDEIASSSFSTITKIKVSGYPTLSTIRQSIEDMDTDTLPETWSFLEFAVHEKEGRYVFITKDDETLRSSKQFVDTPSNADKALNVRQGFFITSTYRLLARVRGKQSLDSDVDGFANRSIPEFVDRSNV